MADISVTAANVVFSVNAKFYYGTAGATITAGQTVYLDSATGKYKLGDANASAATAAIKGIAAVNCSDGQPIQVGYWDDDFTPGATLTNGTVYVASATAGGIAPAADLTTGWYPTVLYVAKSTTKSVLNLVASGAVI